MLNNADVVFEELLLTYLRKLSIPVNRQEFIFQFRSNPDYPSLKSITDTLDFFRIDNVAVEVPKDVLLKLPTNFLALLGQDLSFPSLITKKDKYIEVQSHNGEIHHWSDSEFKDAWNGTILAIEKNETVEHGSNRNLYAIWGLILVVGCSAFTLSLNFSWLFLIQLALILLGMGITYFTTQEVLGIYNSATARLCDRSSANTSCSEVIGSDHSKILGISLNDLAVAWFASLFLTLVVLGYHAAFFFWISMFSLPIIIYSFYVQVFNVKKWCPLCLGISLVLIGSLINSAPAAWIIPKYEYLSSSVIIGSLTFFGWKYLKTKLEASMELNRVRTDLLKFKKSEGLFKSFLEQHPLPYPEKLPEHVAIKFGNPQAKVELTAITNPMCNYCKTSFQEYTHLLETYANQIQIKFVFIADLQNKNSSEFKIITSLINLYQKDPDQAYRALQEWFQFKQVKPWLNKYEMPESDLSLEVMNAHNQWTLLQGIIYTPITCINQYLYPSQYELSDLALFVDELAEGLIKTDMDLPHEMVATN